MDGTSPESPGTDLVPLNGGRELPRELTAAVDLALGAGTAAANAGRGLARTAGRVARVVPGARLAGSLAATATRPLAAEGARTRRLATEEAQRLLEAIVPVVVAALDVDAIVRRIDVDGIVRRIDVDALLARVDVDAIADRVDVNAIVQRVDVDAIVEETELGTIVARSTSGFAAEALDAARTQTVSADTIVTRVVDRLLRRRGEAPLGPPLLVRDEPPVGAQAPRAEQPTPTDPPSGADAP